MRSSTTTPTTAAEAQRFISEHPRAGEIVMLPEVGWVPAPIMDLMAALPPEHRLREYVTEHLDQLWAEALHRHDHGPPGAADLCAFGACLQRLKL